MPAPSRPAAPGAPAAGPPFHVLVPAAGRGDRYGGERPKQFLALHGRPLLAWTLERLFAAGCASLVVALPAEALAGAHERLGLDPRALTVAGGATRQDSVAVALAASPAGPDELVAVHDGARAAVDPADVAAVVAAATAADGAVLGRTATDTLKEVTEGRIRCSLDRRRVFRAETPQVFRRRLLERALEAARRDGFEGTDESALVERLGELGILAVEARAPNPKLTHPEDLALISGLLAGGGR